MFLIALAMLAANPTNIASVINAARPGDTVRLVEGSYPVILIKNRTFSPALNVDASAATVAGLQLFGAVGVHWAGGTIEGSGHPAVPVTDFGVNAAYGSRDININGVHINRFRIGVVLDHVVGGDISNNRLTQMRADGIDIAVSRGLRVADNTCSNFNVTPGEHPDCIQAWSKPTDPPVSDIAITGNSVDGEMQGISFFDQPGAGGFDRVTVAGNTVFTTYGNGIALYNCRSCSVRKNAVNSLPNYMYRAQLYISGGSVTQCGNTVPMVPRQGTPPCQN